jgi:Yip1 domain
MSSPTTPTPPPPPPFPPAIGLPEEPSGPGLSEPSRLINTFFAPRKTFTDLKRNPSWWVPWAISAVLCVIYAIVVVPRIDIQRFLQAQIDRSPSAQRRMEQLPPEQRQQVMTMQAKGTKVTFYVFGVAMLVAEVPFGRSMAIVFYSFFPWNLATILLMISILVSSDPNTIDLTNPMPTNPAFFMDPTGNKFLYGIARNLDIFRLWAVALLGLGFSAASSNRKPSVSTGITTMFVIFALLTLITAAWGSM